MMRFGMLLFLSFCLFGESANAQAASAKTKIYASSWGLTLEQDGTGFYNELARLVFGGLEEIVDYEIQPYRRTNASFIRNQDSCKYPDSLKSLQEGGLLNDPAAFLESKALVNAHMHIFSPPGHAAPSSRADLAGHSVAFPMGALTPMYLAGEGGINFIAVSDELAKAKMLITGRVDFLAASLPDLKFVLEKLGHPMLPYNEFFIVEELPLAVVCHRNAATEAFVARLNEHLETLRKNGRMALFFSQYGIDPHGYSSVD